MSTHTHTPMLGNARKFYIGTGTGTISYTWLAGEQNNSVTLNGNAIEVSDKATTWQKFISGTRGGTAEVTIYADDEDAQQMAALDALFAGSTILCFVGTLATSTPSAGIAFEAVINSISDTNDNNSVATRALSLTITGQPTLYPTTRS